LLKKSWLQRFERNNGEDVLQELKSKTPLMFAKRKTGLKETISIVEQEEELEKICFMENDVNISSFSHFTATQKNSFCCHFFIPPQQHTNNVLHTSSLSISCKFGLPGNVMRYI
jgi:hypothetical protein